MFRPEEVGPLYDLGIAVRPEPDGSLMPVMVKNSKGDIVSLTEVAFMSNPAPGSVQEEATDLQRKDQLVRLSTSNMTDREFTNYPQAQQGDWRGGEGQRIAGDITKYWSGNGLIWPLSNVYPSSSMLQPVVQDGPTSGNASPVQGVVGGIVNGKLGFSFVYRNAGNTPQLVSVCTIDGSRMVDTNAAIANMIDFCIIADRIFYITTDATKVYALYVSDGTTSTLLVSGIAATTRTPLSIYGGIIGGNDYLAVVFSGDTRRATIDLYTITTVPAYGVSGPAPVSMPAGYSLVVQDIIFQGDQLIASIKLGDRNVILSITATGTVTTLARLSGYSAMYLVSVEGTLVVLASNGTPNYQIDIYTLSGGSLSLQVTVPLAYSQIPSSVSKMTQFGPYALFAASYLFDTNAAPFPLGTPNANPLVLYAFDATKGALFTVERLAGPAIGVPKQITALAAQRVIQGGVLPYLTFAWVVAFWAGESLYQIAGFGPAIRSTVAAGNKTAPNIHTSGSIMSSLFDFTQGTPKLYRRVVVDHDPIPAGDIGAKVRLTAWLDAYPDDVISTAEIAAQVENDQPNSKKTSLVINKIAKKIVTEVDYISSTVGVVTPASSAFGGALPGLAIPGITVPASLATVFSTPATLTPFPAPRPIAVAIQAATGWITKMSLAVSDRAGTNNQGVNESCFKNQSGAEAEIDAMAAYNFLRALWRENGAECFIYLPNGDQYNAVMESEAFKSPKPFGVSFIGDRADEYSSFVDVIIREDI